MLKKIFGFKTLKKSTTVEDELKTLSYQQSFSELMNTDAGQRGLLWLVKTIILDQGTPQPIRDPLELAYTAGKQDLVRYILTLADLNFQDAINKIKGEK